MKTKFQNGGDICKSCVGLIRFGSFQNKRFLQLNRKRQPNQKNESKIWNRCLLKKEIPILYVHEKMFIISMREM